MSDNTVTLKQAFTQWANAPRNQVLATKSREAVQRVLMKKWNDIALDTITPALAERMFVQSSESRELKTKAASILVYLLQWGADHGYCKRPAFDYTIASSCAPAHASPSFSTATAPQVQEEPLPHEEPQTSPEPEEETTMSEKKIRGKAPKPVAQIEPGTLKVVKVWPSRCEAERQLGAHNLDRCVAHRRMSAGYYWCAPEDAGTFKPNPMSGKQAVQPSKKAGPKAAPGEAAVPAAASVCEPLAGTVPVKGGASLSGCTSDELLAEMRRRGWKGSITMTVTIEL